MFSVVNNIVFCRVHPRSSCFVVQRIAGHDFDRICIYYRDHPTYFGCGWNGTFEQHVCIRNILCYHWLHECVQAQKECLGDSLHGISILISINPVLASPSIPDCTKSFLFFRMMASRKPKAYYHLSLALWTNTNSRVSREIIILFNIRFIAVALCYATNLVTIRALGFQGIIGEMIKFARGNVSNNF